MYIYSDPIGDPTFRPNIMETYYILWRPNNEDLMETIYIYILWRPNTVYIETLHYLYI